MKERQKRQQKRQVEDVDEQEDHAIPTKSKKTEPDVLALNLPDGFTSNKMAFIPIFFK